MKAVKTDVLQMGSKVTRWLECTFYPKGYCDEYEWLLVRAPFKGKIRESKHIVYEDGVGVKYVLFRNSRLCFAVGRKKPKHRAYGDL